MIQKENFIEKTCRSTEMDQGAIHLGNYKVMLNNFSTETYLQVGILSSLCQTVSCEPNDVFLTVNVRGEKLHECG